MTINLDLGALLIGMGMGIVLTIMFIQAQIITKIEKERRDDD